MGFENDIKSEYSLYTENANESNNIRRSALSVKSDKFKFGLSKIIRSIITKDITNISFPVFINEPLSLNQRITECFQQYRILDECADEKNTVDKLVKIAAFTLSICSLSKDARCRKPFNPLLGETFEYFDKETGFCVISEQVSHHPPITAIHCQTSKWDRQSNFYGKTKFLLTKIKINSGGCNILTLKESQEKFISSSPSLLIHDPASSTPWFEYIGSVEIKKVSSLASVKLHFIPMKTQHDIRGFEGIVYDDKGAIAGILNGSYTDCIYFTSNDGPTAKILDIKSCLEFHPDYYYFSTFGLEMNNPDYDVKCHTDSRFRPDIRYLENGKIEQAEEEKQRLEKKQRESEKLQKSTNSEWTPKWFTNKIKLDSVTEKMYIYTGKYWNSKLKNENVDCSNIY